MSIQSAYTPPRLRVSTTLPTDHDDAVLIVPISTSEDNNIPTLVIDHSQFPSEAINEIEQSLIALNAKTTLENTTRLVIHSLPFTSVLAVGLGQYQPQWPAETIRRAAGAAARALSDHHCVIGVVSGFAKPETIRAYTEGLLLGGYQFAGVHGTKSEDHKVTLTELIVMISQENDHSHVLYGYDVAKSVIIARDFVNTPPNFLFPEEFARRAVNLAQPLGIETEILHEDQLKQHGYGGIIGVGQGSVHPPCLLRLIYRGSSNPHRPRVGLVGKGITFDTGGISIKPAAGMHHMSSDMAGAASVIAVTLLAAQRKLDLDIFTTVPMAENMPSGSAQRPGDVLTQYGGITVEVLNTDAEGRLILADAIARACEDSLDYLIETSTLTGAQTIALGTRTPGIMGSEDFRDRLAEISQRVGEHGWAMPLPEELKEELKSTIADLANISTQRFAGMLVAGSYLAEFVADSLPWVHIDIAGPAYNTTKPWGYTPQGATGVPTRTIYAALEDIAQQG